MIRVAKLSTIFFLFTLSSCYNEEVFSDVPFIEFRSLEFVDTPSLDSLILKFHFEDGDANLGVFENAFSAEYGLYVDSEPKVLTEANIADAVPPVFLASLVLDNVTPVRLNGNTISVVPAASSYPAILSDEVYTDQPDTISFDCPNIINQDLAIFDTLDAKIYRLENSFYEEVLTQEINAPVPALYRETFYNIIIRFEAIINDEPQIIDFSRVGQRNCIPGPESFNARIPIFTEDARSGTVTYNMISSALRLGIGDDPFRVRFFVFDRAGNNSNEVVSPTFLMSEITRN